MIFSTIKRYWFIGLGLLVTGLMATVKILAGRNSRLRRKAEMAEARVAHARIVSEKKQKTAKKFKSRKAEIAREIEEKKATKELSEPNEW